MAVFSAQERQLLSALFETCCPAGNLVPAADADVLPPALLAELARHPLLVRGLHGCLQGLRIGFQLRHRQSFVQADVALRRRFLQSLPGWAGVSERLLTLPLRLQQARREEVAAALSLPPAPPVPAAEPAARWRQQIRRPEDLADEETWEVDAVVIGSGAGGAAAAATLAERGLAVVVLEEGDDVTRQELAGDILQRIPRLYRASGLTMAFGQSVIPVPIGRSVGGTTTINSGTAMPLPATRLAEWRQQGLRDFTDDAWAPWVARVQDILQSAPAEPRYVGEIGRIMAAGAAACGYQHYGPLWRNAPGCDGQAQCQFGCPSAAKRSTQVSFIPRALQDGAVLVTGMKVQALIREGQQVQGCTASGVDQQGRPRVLKIRAAATVVAMGSLLTPVFLQQQGVEHRQIGRGLSLHPAGVVLADFPHRFMDHGRSIPQGFGIHDRQEEGLVFEGGTPPLLAHALLHPELGSAWTEALEQYQHTAYFGFMIRDSSRGRVLAGPHADWPWILYRMNGADLRLFRQGVLELARMYWAAGARSVAVPSWTRMQRFRDERALRRWLATSSVRDFLISAYHPLATCRMGASVAQGVVSGDAEVYGWRGLYVMDGSILPGSIGVNPQVTIMALACRAASRLADRLAAS